MNAAAVECTCLLLGPAPHWHEGPNGEQWTFGQLHEHVRTAVMEKMRAANQKADDVHQRLNLESVLPATSCQRGVDYRYSTPTRRARCGAPGHWLIRVVEAPPVDDPMRDRFYLWDRTEVYCHVHLVARLSEWYGNGNMPVAVVPGPAAWGAIPDYREATPDEIQRITHALAMLTTRASRRDA